MRIALIMILLCSATRSTVNVVQTRHPLRVVLFNETNCSSLTVGPGGVHHEAGRHSICVYPNVIIPTAEDLDTFEDLSTTRCTEEQLSTFPMSCSNDKNNMMIDANPGTIYARRAQVYAGSNPDLPSYRNGVDYNDLLPEATTILHFGNVKGTMEVDMLPSPPNTLRIQIKKGWLGTLREDGMPSTKGRNYNMYMTIGLTSVPQFMEMIAGFTAGTLASAGPIGYRLPKVITGQPDNHRQTYSTVFGTEQAALNSVDNPVNHRIRLTAKGSQKFPHNIEYLGEGRPLQIGDVFELTPGEADDLVQPRFHNKPSEKETFLNETEAGLRYLVIIFNIITDEEIINESIFKEVYLCEDGIVVEPGQMCCKELRETWESECCENTNSTCVTMKEQWKVQCKSTYCNA